MINEANASSSACRLWRISRIETGTPPKLSDIIIQQLFDVQFVEARGECRPRFVIIRHCTPALGRKLGVGF